MFINENESCCQTEFVKLSLFFYFAYLGWLKIEIVRPAIDGYKLSNIQNLKHIVFLGQTGLVFS
jgi:hypothetical protein